MTSPPGGPLAWQPVLDDEPDRPLVTTSSASTSSATRESERRKLGAAAEIPLLIAVACVIAFLLRTLVAQAFYIPSGSMLPQLQINDRVVVSKLSYRLHDAHRGDIVVFECPPQAGCIERPHSSNPVVRGVRFFGERIGIVQPSTEDYIKRVVGLPGDVVEGRAGRVYVNGFLMEEPYLPPGTVTSDFGPVVIPEDELWVMGDNRSNSSDSRRFGAIKESSVVGRAVLRVWPVPSASFL